jgi:hypothetical protein
VKQNSLYLNSATLSSTCVSLLLNFNQVVLFPFHRQIIWLPKLNLTIDLILLNLPGPLNTNVCAKKQDIFDTNNVYLQSACLITEQLTYSRSEAYCQANGMDLIDISSEESKTALLEYATDIFGESGFAFLQVKGRDFEMCQYIYNENGPFEALYGYCYDELYSFCGYQNSNPTGTTESPTNLERKLI